MDIYLPIANMSVNAAVIVLLGAMVGILSGMFGVGGGFLTTPLLIFYGVPPTIAAASASTQVTGASISGVLAYAKGGGVDYRMGAVLVVGGILGTGIGALLFQLLNQWGQTDTVINFIYVLMLGSIGAMMARESFGALRAARAGQKVRAMKRRHHPLVAMLPGRYRFYASGLYISPLAPLLLGVFTGIMTMLLGVGGGFIMVPAMLYLLGMGARVVVGTSLFQILFVTIGSTMMHSLTTRAVDIVLSVLLLIGSVAGAQLGARFAGRMQPELLRFLLAIIVLFFALIMIVRLTWRPDEIYTLMPL